MTYNPLILDRNKTELMVVAPQGIARGWWRSATLYPWVYHLIIPPEACNLRVTIDCTLSFQSHIKSVTKSTFFHLKNPAFTPLPSCWDLGLHFKPS